MDMIQYVCNKCLFEMAEEFHARVITNPELEECEECCS